MVTKSDIERDLNLLKLHDRAEDAAYERKNHMTMVIEAKAKEMAEGGLKLTSPVGGETLSEKKRRLKQSFDDKKMLNKLMKKDMMKPKIKVSDPPTVTPGMIKK